MSSYYIMPNPWIDHIKQFAKKHKLTYWQALKHPKLKATYKPTRGKGLTPPKKENTPSIPDATLDIADAEDMAAQDEYDSLVLFPQLEDDVEWLVEQDNNGTIDNTDVWDFLHSLNTFIAERPRRVNLFRSNIIDMINLWDEPKYGRHSQPIINQIRSRL